MVTKLVPAWVTMDPPAGRSGGGSVGVRPVDSTLPTMDAIFSAGWTLKAVYPLPPRPLGDSPGSIPSANYAVLLHLERPEEAVTLVNDVAPAYPRTARTRLAGRTPASGSAAAAGRRPGPLRTARACAPMRSAPARSPRARRHCSPVRFICQVRLPPILRIDTDVPARFQDLIRDEFPLVTEENVGLPPELPAEVSQLLRAALTSQAQRKTWRFGSADGGWSVALNRDFLALSTDAYTRWEVFRQRLVVLLESLKAEYRPAFYTRLGLRYQNVIARSDLGLVGVPWSRLIEPHVAGPMGAPAIAEEIQEATSRILFRLPHDQGSVNLRHGTGTREHDDEPIYLIDADFFSEDKAEVDNVFPRLDCFNQLATRLFRWCISDELHTAMGPTPI
jgi:uncharacterized protein (TIGR04255 family)